MEFLSCELSWRFHFWTSSTNSQAFDGHYAAWCESDQHGTFDEMSGHPVDVVFVVGNGRPVEDSFLKTQTFWCGAITRWWFQIYFFNVHPYLGPLGKWSNFTNIFQMGWNHQLDKCWKMVFPGWKMILPVFRGYGKVEPRDISSSMSWSFWNM